MAVVSRARAHGNTVRHWLGHFSVCMKRLRYSNRAVIVIYSNRAFNADYSHCSHYSAWSKSFTLYMLIVFKLLFKLSSSETTAWHYTELIDHAYQALAVTIKKNSPTCHFKAYIFKPLLPSLTCLAYVVEYHMKEIAT